MSTPKQQNAMKRNWSIHQLRGITAIVRGLTHIGVFTEGEKNTIIVMVDTALTRVGAETEASRYAEWLKVKDLPIGDPKYDEYWDRIEKRRKQRKLRAIQYKPGR